MPASSALNKINNSLGKLLNNIDDLTYEDALNKINNIADNLTALKRSDFVIDHINDELKLICRSLIGVLSDNSLKNLKKVLAEIHAILKAYELIIFVQEAGYVDESVMETYEPYVDTETGEVSEEANSHVKDKIYSILASKFGDDRPNLLGLLFDCKNIFDDSFKALKSCSAEYFNNMRQMLAPDIEGYAVESQAQQKELYRQYRTSRTFFSPQKNTNPEAKRIAEKMYQNRTKAREYKETFTIANTPYRHVITGAYSAIQETSKLENIPKFTGERVDMGGTEVYWQNKYSENNVGNLVVGSRNLGRYGFNDKDDEYDPKAIMSLIDKATEYMDEQTLAEYMIKYSREGNSFSLNDFNLRNIKKNRDFVDSMNRLMLLTSCAEIWRYMQTTKNPTEDKPKKSITKAEHIAFANAHARVLQLIANGELDMQDVFDEDAIYGAPTGSKITKNIPKVVQKMLDINDLYNQTEIVDCERAARKFLKLFPNGGIASFRETHMSELGQVFDKKFKIKDEDCESSDEETNGYRYR